MKRLKQWACALLALMLLVSLSVPAFAAELVYREAKTSTTIYKGPGTEYAAVAKLPKGDVVTVTSMWLTDWWRVKYTNAQSKSYEGYVSSSALKETSKRKNEKKNLYPLGCYSAITELNLRSGRGTEYQAKTVVPKGNLVEVTDTTDEHWFAVTFIDKKGTKYTGYLSHPYLKKAAEPYQVKSKTQLRKSASTSSKNLKTLPKGSYLSVTAVYSSKWLKVNYTDIEGETTKGYVLKSKVKRIAVSNKPVKQVDPEAEAKLLAENWRTAERYQLTAKTKLTKSASTKGKKLATLAKGTVVAKVSTKGKFYKVIWNDGSNKKIQGYLPKSKLKKRDDPAAGEYVTKVATSLRKSDSKSGDVLVELKEKTPITVKDTSLKDWLWADYTDDEGKTYTGFVRKSHAEQYVEKNAGNYCAKVDTDLRETASPTGKELAEIPEGSLVKVTKTSNADWYYVTFKGADGKSKKGYVKSGHLKKFRSLKQDFVARVDTELRNQPSSSAKVVLAEIAEGEAVVVNDTPVEGWYWAIYKDENGKKYKGFVNASHLKEKEQSTEPETPAQPEQTTQPETPTQPEQTAQTEAPAQTEQPKQEESAPAAQSADEPDHEEATEEAPTEDTEAPQEAEPVWELTEDAA